MDSNGWNIITAAKTSDIEVKKSHFLGELKHVKSEDEAREFIYLIKKKHYDARHNCFAMRIGRPGDVFERSGDDGEPQGTAGRPMLDILKGEGLYDVCAVVTRYFGGTLLGTGGLVRAYSDALKKAVEVSEKAAVLKGSKIAVRCGYQCADKIKRYAMNNQISALDEEYAESCTFYFLVQAGAEDKFIGGINDISLGKAGIDILGETLYTGGRKPILYE